MTCIMIFIVIGILNQLHQDRRRGPHRPALSESSLTWGGAEAFTGRPAVVPRLYPLDVPQHHPPISLHRPPRLLLLLRLLLPLLRRGVAVGGLRGGDVDLHAGLLRLGLHGPQPALLGGGGEGGGGAGGGGRGGGVRRWGVGRGGVGGGGVGVAGGGVGFVLLLAGIRGLLLLFLELLLLQAALLLAELGAAVFEPHLEEGDAGEHGGHATADSAVRDHVKLHAGGSLCVSIGERNAG